MGYRRMNINDLKSIYQHLKADHSITKISESTGFDRKTIREYRERIQTADILDAESGALEIQETLFSLLPVNCHPPPFCRGSFSGAKAD